MTRFLKMHGCGNDFVVLDARKHDFQGFLADVGAVSRVADRRFGVGCDQLIAIAPHAHADAEMLIRNADGTVAGMCGNAARCVADILLRETGKAKVVLQVGARALECWRGDTAFVTVDMGEPKGLGNLAVLPELPEAVTVDMGNPHAVFFVPDADAVELEGLGPRVETHALFPNRTNVEFASVTGQGIRMRVWERGAGITLACGSGACATAVAAVSRKLVGRKTDIRMDGGTLNLEWRESDGHVLMSGPVTYVFEGSLAA